MFIKDLRRDFYEVIIREHVLIIANADVDAVCAFKILQALFRCDHVSYTLVPVAKSADLCRAISEHATQMKYVVLINCGGTMNLIDVISSPDELIFFILDSHRPLDLDNIYDSDKVRILIKSDEDKELAIPSRNELHYDEHDQDDEQDNEQEKEDTADGQKDSTEYDSGDDLFASPKSKKRRRHSRTPVSRRRWEEERNRLMFDYYEFAYYSNSSALLLFELSWSLSRDNNDLLWWACIGVASQFMERKINLARYVIVSTDLHQHLQRLNREAEKSQNGNTDCLKIVYEKDLLLSLYRCWSLFDSLRHTVNTACHFKSWTNEGERQLRMFLADVGIPLTQCRQRYSAMDGDIRKEVHKAVDEKLEKYGLKDLICVTFAAQYSFAHKISASDTAEAIAAALHCSATNDLDSNFLTAVDCLSRSYCSLLHECVGQCKTYLKILWSEVTALLNNGHLVPYNSFLMVQLPLGTPGLCYFSKPHGLATLGHCLLRAFISQVTKNKHKNKPMIIMAPRGGEEGNEWHLVVGIPPAFTLNDDKPTNCLGQAFHRVADTTRCRIRFDFFDDFVILLRVEDKDRFCTAVSTMLDV